VIPTWRSPTTTPYVPNPAPAPEVRARADGKAIKNPFAHFSHTFTNEKSYLRIVDLEYYARFKLSELFTGLMYMNIILEKR
jgi:hypothetical protein